MSTEIVLYGLLALILGWFLVGIRIIRPIEKGLIETLGKYQKTVEQGFHWIWIPFQSLIKVNITERMVDVPPQTIQTSDKLNMTVDAVVYYQIRDVKASQYNVDNHQRQLTSLARTTLRAVMGKMSLTECIQERNKINTAVETILDKETDNYGVKVLRVEVQRIEPPQDVQEAMNEVVKAEQNKIAAKDTATALETEADGIRRAAIKKADGQRESTILEAKGMAEGKKIVADAESYRIQQVNTAAEKYFKGNAQTLKRLQVTEASLENNSKIILTKDGINPQLIIGEIPLISSKASKE